MIVWARWLSHKSMSSGQAGQRQREVDLDRTVEKEVKIKMCFGKISEQRDVRCGWMLSVKMGCGLMNERRK